MRKNLITTLLLLIAGSMLLYGQSTVKRLQDVKTIYVLPLRGENTELANLINAKLISYLAKYRAISVVETADHADAILTGSGLIETTTNPYGRPSPHVQAAMRLDSKDGVVLWGDDISNSPFAQSATSSFAENVASRLVKAILAVDERK